MDTPRLFKIVLSPLQAYQFTELLDQAKTETGFEGLLCTVARHFDSASGGSIVELQTTKLSPSAIRKIQKIIAEEQGKKVVEVAGPVTAASQGSSEDEPEE
jgi:hypothetical protein